MKHPEFIFNSQAYIESPEQAEMVDDNIDSTSSWAVDELQRGRNPVLVTMELAANLGDSLAEIDDMNGNIQRLIILNAHLTMHVAKLKSHGAN